MHKANKAAPKKKGGSSLPHSKYSFLYVRYTIVFSDSQGKVWRFSFRVAERPSKILSVNACDRCSSMGVPPPIVTEPLAAMSPLPSTLNLVTPALCPRRMLPALPAAPLLNIPAAAVALVLEVPPEMPTKLVLMP